MIYQSLLVIISLHRQDGTHNQAHGQSDGASPEQRKHNESSQTIQSSTGKNIALILQHNQLAQEGKFERVVLYKDSMIDKQNGNQPPNKSGQLKSSSKERNPSI